jgi:(p)ppGpp synthase/HD superfamily hydrolase
MIEIAKKLAINSHNFTNCMYDNKPYQVHLQMVVGIANRFINLVPVKDIENVISACWLHDTIEDCRLTYNDIKVATNEDIAEIVYALTNEKGKSRSERANDIYYNGIKNTPYASFVKICDRIANYKYSLENNNGMAIKYEQEMNNFKSQLFDEKYKPMFDYLQKLVYSNNETILYVVDKGDSSVGIDEIEYAIQCPFYKIDVEDKELEYFRNKIIDLYQQYTDTRIIADYNHELINEI